MDEVRIERLDAGAARAAAAELGALIADAVAGGASVGFTRPPAEADAHAWGAGVAADVDAGQAILLVARGQQGICGCVQLRLASQENGRHRAEVAKLMVLRAARSHGIGRRLMDAVVAEGKAEGLRTLVLDTETGSDAERLYRRSRWNHVGNVPEYAASPAGGLRSTSFFFLLI